MNLQVVTASEFTYVYLSKCLEGILYGFYSGIFAMYLHCHACKLKERTDNAKNIISYALCLLYLLSAAMVAFDIAISVIDPHVLNSTTVYPLYIVQGALFGCCDFIAQSILIYRCWIVWRYNVRVLIIPSILAIVFLVTWMASISPESIEQGQITTTGWGAMLNVSSLGISLTVNALVTGSIVFKIFKVFREVKATSANEVLNVSCGTKTRSVMFIIIESGMALFSIQLARMIVTGIVLTYPSAHDAFELIAVIHQMLNGITATIILVRGLSFDNGTSMVEAAENFMRFLPDDPNLIPEIGSISQDEILHFAPNDVNPIPGTGNIGQEERDDSIGGSDDLWMEDRLR